MSPTKLRAGVIGCRLGAYHGFAYANAPSYELVAICDIRLEAYDFFYEYSKLPRGVYKEYSDYRAMIEQERLDVVTVATPDHLHVNPVVDAANMGVKGIFCEKPLAISLEDGDRMVEAVQRNGTQMSVDHTRSFIPKYQAVRAMVRAGEIGGLTRIVAHMGGRRSMLFRNGTHLIDGVCFYADAAPLWVIAAHERGFEDYGTTYKGQGGRDPMLDPGSSLIIEFANGVRGIVNSAKLTPEIFEFDLQGPTGRILVNDSDGGSKAWKAEKPEGALAEVAAPWSAGNYDDLAANLIPAVEELAQMIWHGAPSSSPPQRALYTLEIMLAALLSQSRDSAKVYLPLPRG